MAETHQSAPDESADALLALTSKKEEVERRFITLDGVPHYLRNVGEFSLKQQAEMLRAGARMQRLFGSEEERPKEMSDAQFDVAVANAEKSLDKTIETIMAGDPAAILALELDDRMKVVRAFNQSAGNASGVQDETPQASSPDSSGSTDSTRSD